MLQLLHAIQREFLKDISNPFDEVNSRLDGRTLDMPPRIKQSVPMYQISMLGASGYLQ